MARRRPSSNSPITSVIDFISLVVGPLNQRFHGHNLQKGGVILDGLMGEFVVARNGHKSRAERTYRYSPSLVSYVVMTLFS